MANRILVWKSHIFAFHGMCLSAPNALQFAGTIKRDVMSSIYISLISENNPWFA